MAASEAKLGVVSWASSVVVSDYLSDEISKTKNCRAPISLTKLVRPKM